MLKRLTALLFLAFTFALHAGSTHCWTSINRATTNSPLSSDVFTWTRGVQNASGTFLPIDVFALDRFTKREKRYNNGSIWTKKLVEWIPAGSDISAAVIPLKTSGYAFANSGMTTYARNVGVTRHTTGIHVDMGIKPSDIGTILMHVACYTTTTLADNTTPIGCSDASAANRCRIDTASTSLWRAFQGGGLANAAVAAADANRKGRFISNRTTLSRLDLWQNGSSIGNNTTALSDVPASVKLHGFEENANGSSSGGITGKSLGELSVGLALTDAECAEDTAAIEECMATLGRSAL